MLCFLRKKPHTGLSHQKTGYRPSCRPAENSRKSSKRDIFWKEKLSPFWALQLSMFLQHLICYLAYFLTGQAVPLLGFATVNVFATPHLLSRVFFDR